MDDGNYYRFVSAQREFINLRPFKGERATFPVLNYGNVIRCEMQNNDTKLLTIILCINIHNSVLFIRSTSDDVFIFLNF